MTVRAHLKCHSKFLRFCKYARSKYLYVFRSSVRARGGSSSGIKSGMLDIDTNSLLALLFLTDRLSNLRNGLQE